MVALDRTCDLSTPAGQGYVYIIWSTPHAIISIKFIWKTLFCHIASSCTPSCRAPGNHLFISWSLLYFDSCFLPIWLWDFFTWILYWTERRKHSFACFPELLVPCCSNTFSVTVKSSCSYRWKPLKQEYNKHGGILGCYGITISPLLSQALPRFSVAPPLTFFFIMSMQFHLHYMHQI